MGLLEDDEAQGMGEAVGVALVVAVDAGAELDPVAFQGGDGLMGRDLHPGVLA